MSVTGQLRDIVSMGRGGDNHISLPWAMWQLLGGGPLVPVPANNMHALTGVWLAFQQSRLDECRPSPAPCAVSPSLCFANRGAGLELGSGQMANTKSRLDRPAQMLNHNVHSLSALARLAFFAC